MKQIQLLSLLYLLAVLPIHSTTADLTVTWVRTGTVLETKGKNELVGKINVTTLSNGTTHPLTEPPTVQKIDTHRILLKFPWQPHQKYQFNVNGQLTTATSPLKPVPFLIRTVALDAPLTLMARLQRPAKPTAIALAPQNATNTPLLAIATDTGHLALLHPLTGKTLWKTRISEGYVTRITFSPNSTRLYIGEQAADGFVYCYNLQTDKPTLLWKYRTADDIDTSTPRNPDNAYAWITYPGPARMQTLPNGDLLVAAVHSWTQDNIPLKKSQLYRFDKHTGNAIWKWPSENPTLKLIRWFDISSDGKTLALLTDSGHNLQGSTPHENNTHNGTLTLLNAADGKERWHSTIEPLYDDFQQVTFWRGVSISPNGQFINVTTDDGRAFIFNTDTAEPTWQKNLTTPLEVSGIPIVATSGTIAATDTTALFVTGDTYIPYHLRKSTQRPAAAHPNGMTLFAYAWTGEKTWQWKLENMPQALRIDSNGRYAALSVSKRTQNPNENLHGVSLFDLTAEGSGLMKYLYTYRTQGQLPYDTLAISTDGTLIALVEIPILLPDETPRGKNQVHILY